MQCSACNHENPDDARFCAQCGSKLAPVCDQCGAEAAPGARYCTQCGSELGVPARPAPADDAAALRPDAERRQLTVMFCDLVGSTELATRFDPEELRELNRKYRSLCNDTIQRYEGYIARYMGDGVLAYFGYPRAHEDDPARAVHAALDLVAFAPTLAGGTGPDIPVRIRVGIATGPVVVGELIGEGAAQEHDVVGETPNLAARLQSLAQSNEVVVSDDTRKLIGGGFATEDLGEHSLKGFDRPVRAWRVLGAESVETRFDATASSTLTPFIGRDHEIGLVTDCWTRAEQGEGQVVLLCGEPGIGKSRITRAVRERLGDRVPVTIRCQCSPYHTSSALYPVIDHLRRAAGFVDGDAAGSMIAKLGGVVDPEKRLSADELALFASLLSLPAVDGQRAPDLDPEALRERTLEAILNVLENVSRRQPLLILFEDVHWSDPTTLELIGALVERIAAWPAMLMATFRPGFQSPWAGEAHVSLLTLKRLDRRQCRAIVSRLAGGKSLPDEIHERILERTDGVPLFVEELTRTLLDSGMLVERDDAYELAGAIDPLEIPATLQDSLMARLDQLDDAKSLAQIGAAIGREFPEPLLTAVSGLTPVAVRPAMERLVESGLVFRRGEGGRATYVFKHALIRDAAYNSLLKSRRLVLHGRIADVLTGQFAELGHMQPEVVAQHFVAAGRPSDALDYWVRAGQLSVERSAYREAISHFRQALQCTDAMERSGETVSRTVALNISLAECLRVVDSIDEAFSTLREAEDAAVGSGLNRELARIHHQRGNLFFPAAKTAECLAEHRLALEFARKAQSVTDEVRALGGLGDAYYVSGQMRTAKEHFSRCVTLARSQGMNNTVAANLSMIGFSRTYLLQIEESLQDGADAIKIARDAGDRRGELLGYIMQSLGTYYMADYARAIENCDKAESLARRLGAKRFQPQNLYHKALGLLHLGRRDEARQLLEEAETAARRFSKYFSLARVLSGIALTTDDPSRRDEALQEGERLLREGTVSHNYFAFCLDATDLYFDQGDWSKMRHYADLLEAYTTKEPLPMADFIISRARVLSEWGAGNRGGAVVGELQRLVTLGRETRFLSPLGRVESALGEAGRPVSPQTGA